MLIDCCCFVVMMWDFSALFDLMFCDCLILVFLGVVFLFLLIMIDSFFGYSSLRLHLWFLRICRTSFQVFLAFRVFIEKSEVILMGLFSYVTWSFSLTAFNILSLNIFH